MPHGQEIVPGKEQGQLWGSSHEFFFFQELHPYMDNCLAKDGCFVYFVQFYVCLQCTG